MSKQRLLFITTGGTIASVHTPQGLRPVLSSDELLAHLPELNDLCIPETLALCSIDSTDLGQEHWLMMARAIQENYALYDGFIICHGTDTLAYSAAALSYLIQNADKPIILTGAQQPISNEITDAKKNLRDSVTALYTSIIHQIPLISMTKSKSLHFPPERHFARAGECVILSMNAIQSS